MHLHSIRCRRERGEALGRAVDDDGRDAAGGRFRLAPDGQRL